MANSDNYLDFEPMSNFDIIKTLYKEMKERANIIDTRKITGNESFNNLWNNKGHCILFEPNEDDINGVGHWTALVRQKGNKNKPETCIYFDSYGSPLTNERIKRILAQKYKQIQYNPHQLQEFNTNLCGAYAITCVCLNKLIPDLDVKKMIRFFNLKNKKDNYDEFVYKIANS